LALVRSPTRVLSTRFILSDIVESQVADENGYSIFEPTVALEINGKNVFQSLGIEGARITVVMHFRKAAIKETGRMIDDLAESKKGEYNYPLLGTGFGFRLERNDHTLKVFVIVDRTGPTQGVSWPQRNYVGTIAVDEWVQAVVSLSTDLNRIFGRLNPEILNDPLVQRQEAAISQLGEWLRIRKPT